MFNLTLYRFESQKVISDFLAFNQIFVTPENTGKTYDIIRVVIAKYGFDGTHYIPFQYIQEKKEEILKALQSEDLLRDITLKDKTRIKNGFRAIIVFKIMNTDFFGYKSGTQLLFQLPKPFGKYISTNTGAPVVRQSSSLLADYGYSKFINNEHLFSEEDKEVIIDELIPVIENISKKNKEISKQFSEFRSYMLSLKSL